MHSATQPCKKVDSQFPANSSPSPPAPSPSLPGGLRESFREPHKSAPRWESDGNSASSIPEEQEAGARAHRLPAVPCWRGAAGRNRSWRGSRRLFPSPRLASPAPHPAPRRGASLPTFHSAHTSEESPSLVQIPIPTCKQRCAAGHPPCPPLPVVLRKALG